ncbi:hypothetical protein HMI51_09985 [Corallococcus coralloides]|nr:hypothetical protein [Corallococcus coralloides]
MTHDNDLYEQVLMDALISTAAVSRLLGGTDPETLAAFDFIQDEAEKKHRSFFSAADSCGKPVTLGLASLVLQSLLLNFFKGGAQQLREFPYTLPLIQYHPDQPEGKLFETFVQALSALALLDEDEPTGAEAPAAEASDAFRELAEQLSAQGHPQEALTCAGIACNLAALLNEAGTPRLLVGAGLAVTLAHRLGDADQFGVAEARRAAVLARAAEKGGATQLAAFEALERALIHLPTTPEKRHGVIGMLGNWFRHEPYRPLGGLFLLGSPEIEKPSKFSELGDMSALLTPISDDGNLRHWFLVLTTIEGRTMLSEVENQRLKLQGPEPAPEQWSEADWGTFSIHHPALLRAVPHGRSFLREGDLHQIQLVLKHELMHIYSMSSQVGLALLALRALTLDHELRLWSCVPGGPKLRSPEEMVRQGVAPFEGNDPILLAQAEQALQLTRKAQVLKECWEPWFEGIAVFTELADDPTMVTYSSGVTTQVLSQLVDGWVDAGTKAGATDPSSRGMTTYHEAERRYSEALAQVASLRLRTYVTSEHSSHYLPGYLFVRSIVAGWRRTLQRPITGAAASIVLLHLTRFGSAETVPDLSLPLKHFRAEAVSRMKRWVEQAATLTREDLENFLAPEIGAAVGDERDALASRTFIWKKGRLERRELSPDAGEKYVQDLVEQASQSLCANNADGGRVQGVDPTCQALMGMTADELTRVKYDEKLITSVLELKARKLDILPLGEVEAPFWLNRPDHRLFALIRTTRKRVDSGRPAYDGLCFSLSNEDFSALAGC